MTRDEQIARAHVLRDRNARLQGVMPNAPQHR